jgi:putative transposase
VQVAESRSSLYYVPIGVNAGTWNVDEIDRIVRKYPFFGSRQIAAYFAENGFHGRHRVRRLMGIMGLQNNLQGQTPAKKLPTASHLPLPATEVYQSRARTFGGDITYIPVRRGFLYLSGDYGLGDAQRYWRGSCQNFSLDANFCVEALKDHRKIHSKPEML